VQLRSYQQEAVEKTLEFLKSNQGNPLIVAPTGSGKSLIIASLCSSIRKDKSKRVIVLAHRKELLTQNAVAIKLMNKGAIVDFYSSALRTKSLRADIIVAGIASINRVSKDKLPEIDYIIIDEAHLVNNENQGIYREFIANYPDARVIGLSATPFRLNGGLSHRHKNSIFTDIAVEISLLYLMEKGYLSLLTSKSSAVEVDISDVHIRGGEFVQEEYEPKFNNKSIISRAVDDILLHAKDRKSWLIFCSSVSHAKKVNQEIVNRGITSEVITGNTPVKDRDLIIHKFKERKINAITNCDVLTVGFDAPNVDVIIILRPTKSCGLFMQICGRGTRTFPEKRNCMILDYGGNLKRFGPIDHITFEENKFGKVEVEKKHYKICPDCRECIPLEVSMCFACGHKYEVRGIERNVKHDTQASDLDVISTKFLRDQFDGKQELQVYDYKFIIFKKGDNPPCVKVDYYLSEQDVVSEYVCIEHRGIAYERAQEWWKKHTKKLTFPANCNEFLNFKDKFILPKKVVVETLGQYFVIKKKIN